MPASLLNEAADSLTVNMKETIANEPMPDPNTKPNPIWGEKEALIAMKMAMSAAPDPIELIDRAQLGLEIRDIEPLKGFTKNRTDIKVLALLDCGSKASTKRHLT